MKKILFTSYYYDFSRFFSKIADALMEMEDVTLNVEFVSFYPSAQYYINKKTKYISNPLYKIRRGSNKKEPNYHEIYNYSLIVNPELNKYLDEIENEAASIKEFWEEKLKGVDLIVSSGDTRPQTVIMLEVAKSYNIKVVFFEQGPFGTTVLDTNGVNGNSSFNSSYSLINDDILSIITNKRKHEKYIKELTLLDRGFKYIDLLYMMPPLFFKKYFPIYTQTGDSFFVRLKNKISSRKNKRDIEINLDAFENIALLALQVPYDAQMIYHSPNYKTQEEMFFSVLDNLPEGVTLIVREHPLFKGRYNKDLYDAISENSDRVIIDNSNSLDNQLSKSAVVIVNNSMTGLDALLKRKSVIVLGDAWYGDENIVYLLNNKSQLKDIIISALNNPKDQKNLLYFLTELYEDYLFKCHFQDLKFDDKDVLEISNFIINKLEV
ncbi:TPA: hypothetical protein ACN33P_002655 [Vibrio parahaemolyticus]|nr:hypothetical protein [Vibrio parahaemolyticus]